MGFNSEGDKQLKNKLICAKKEYYRIREILKKTYKKYKKVFLDNIYYRLAYNSSKHDQRNDLARIVDYTLSRILIFFIFFAAFILKRPGIYLSLFKTITILLIFHMVTIFIKKEKISRLNIKKRRKIAGQRVYKEIINMTVAEMHGYIYEILSRIGVSDLKTINQSYKDLLIQSKYKNDKVLIFCYIHKRDFDIELKELKEFLYLLKKKSIRKGIFITVSDFTQDCYDYVNKIDDDFSLLLINKDKLLNIIRLKGMFPPEEEIDEIILNERFKQKRNWKKYKNATLSSKNIKNYFVLSVFFMLISTYMHYTMYYIIASFVTMFLTCIGFIIYVFDFKFEKEDDGNEIENLLEEF